MAFEERAGALEPYFQERAKYGSPQLEEQAQRILRPEQDEDSLLLSGFKDLALAVPRGIEGFGRSLISLADAIPGVDLELPKERLFGESETILGGVASGIVQFSLGFLPGVGLAGRLGKLGFLGSRVKTAAEASASIGEFLMASPAGLNAGVGAVADFLAFDGNDARLSNLIQAAPQLQNPITEFLAAKEEDPELVGRLKNSLEGLGMGALLDTLLVGLRGTKKLRESRKVTSTVGELEAAKVSANPPGAVDEAVGKGFDFLSGKTVDDSAVPGPEAIGLPEPPKPVDPLSAPPSAANPQPVTSKKFASEDPVERMKVLEKIGIPADQVEDFAQQVEFRETLPGPQKSNPRKMSKLERTVNVLSKKSGNFENTVLNEGGATVLRSMEDFLSATAKESEQGVVRIADDMEKAVKEVAGLLDDDPFKVLENVRNSLKGNFKGSLSELQEMLRIRLVSIETVSSMMANRYAQHLEAFSKHEVGSLEQLQQFWSVVDDIRAETRKLKGESGRTLRIQQELPTDPLAEKAFEVSSRIFGYGADEATMTKMVDQMKLAYQDGGIDGAAALLKHHDMTVGRGIWHATVEFRVNNMLGGASTLSTNQASAMMMSILTPLEQIVGGAILRDKNAVKQAFGELVSLPHGLGEAWRLAKKSLKTGQVFGTEATAREGFGAQKFIVPETFGVDPNSVLGQSIGWFGKFIRVPSALMKAGDTFSKVMVQRSVVRNGLMEEAVAKGLRGEQIQQFVNANFDAVVKEGQFQTESVVRAKLVAEAHAMGKHTPAEVSAYLRQEMPKRAEDFERINPLMERAFRKENDVTFQSPLAPGGIAQKVENVLNSHPVFKHIVPFYKTPVNIAKAVGSRVDFPHFAQSVMSTKFEAGSEALASVHNRMIQDMASGGSRKAEAIGRLATGTGLMTSGMLLASQGLITGKGPEDKEMRNAMIDAGWQPYSFRVGDTFQQYLKMDPLGAFFGISADIFDTLRLTENEDTQIPQLMNAFLVSLANNLTQRSYIQGLSQAFDAFSSPQRNMASFVEQFAGSMVPSSIAQLTQLSGDGAMFDTQGILDRIRSRVPYLSEGATKMRNALGEVITRQKAFSENPIGAFYGMFTPIMYREVSDDKIKREFFDLQFGLSPPRANYLGLDFRTFTNSEGRDAYDRWQELQGQVKIQGKTLRQELRRLISSREYQKLDPRSTITGPSARVQLIRSVIRQYRDVSQDAMFQEYPELRQAVGEAERRKVALRRGGRLSQQEGGFIQRTIGGL